ncbi:universal stress protein [Roseinatronobacter bogoriensis]|uniref:Universal stress protein n=1 Tax=Roseinatronobacter bogoriensis subsp. barguzinensis TaxID=441209 RepID=A0A2K8KG49_9RHOB|nr:MULTISPECIES: universal stress protein [Rhodobaca]ATX66725.1 universal stress protein [Rhodobaca barguzinensis]MBB4206183.1 nucleotide-binding universal stress UspA family protein [Rhodobaca bogoriensis DSM 18756]TDW40927.1 nucleotide-binding universal stress UspA family protein [Rhodobaca barguzinensis]TDY74895.1 nucleotide-binding universal stress UspA family protein [Rhodobaca bogoriensis DSM 18756]
MYGRIIVAVDLEHIEQGRALLERAATFLDEGGEIRLLHVLEDVPGYIAAELPSDISERRRAEAVVELRAMIDPKADIRIAYEVRRGAASGQILQAAEDSGAELIMIASHKPGLRDYFIGSTAARVIRHAKCSVLVER